MTSRRRGPGLRRSGGFVGMGGLACVLFVDVASAGVLRWWVVVLLVLLWVLLLGIGARWFTPHPRRVLVLPFVGLAAWLVCVLAAR